MRSDATPDMHVFRFTKIKEIEEEFGEPFWDIVQGFADLGYGKYATARAIGYSPKAFLRLEKINPAIQWPAIKDQCFWKDIDYRPRAPAVSAGLRKRARRYYVRGEWLCQSEIVERYGTTYRKLGQRIKKGLTGEDLLKPAMSKSEAGKLGAAKVHGMRRHHPWKAA